MIAESETFLYTRATDPDVAGLRVIWPPDVDPRQHLKALRLAQGGRREIPTWLVKVNGKPRLALARIGAFGEEVMSEYGKAVANRLIWEPELMHERLALA